MRILQSADSELETAILTLASMRKKSRGAKNILRKLKLCVTIVLLGTLALGTVAFMGYFRGIFAQNLFEGVQGVTEDINTALKTREAEFAGRKATLHADYLGSLNHDVGILQQTIPGPLWNVETDAAEGILTAFLAKPEIAALRVDDDGGKLFSAIEKKNGKIAVVKELEGFAPAGKPLVGELQRGGKKIGTVTLFYHEEPLTKQLAQVDEDLDRFRRSNASLTESINHSLQDTIKRQANKILFLRVVEMVAVFAVSIITLTLFIRFYVVRPLRTMLSSLGEGSSQIEAAATQVATGAEHLADGTSKEAAAIQETSSTVEELSSTTKRNAQHAGETERLTTETRATVGEAGKAMRTLFDSIQQIKNSSAETSKIVKTIDEISFQTNILALNAAVEAARAGEHGAGFAVVAEEVRTLARRAAESAKDTSQLIEATNRQIAQASSLVEVTRQGFDLVNSRVEKTSSFVSEIASASAEQASGLQLLNSNLTEIDHVVQDTVANAEQSATAAQQMCAQINRMNEVISDLRLLVGVRDSGETSHARSASKREEPSGSATRSEEADSPPAAILPS